MKYQMEIHIQKTFEKIQLDVALQSNHYSTLVIGGNGSGKSTLLRCVVGEIVPDKGVISMTEEPFFHSEEGLCLPIHQRKIGYVPQQDVLFNCFDNLDNISIGLWKHSSKSKEELRDMAYRLLDELGFANLGCQFPQYCSGGQRRIISIARALLMKPKLLLLDEPLHSIDLPTKIYLVNYILGYIKKHEIPCLWVTHDGIVLKNHNLEHILYIEEGKGALLNNWPEEGLILQTLRRDLLM